MLRSRDPIVVATERDDDVSQLEDLLAVHYEDESDDEPLPSGLDGALRSIFDDAPADDAASPVARLPAQGLILLMEPDLVANVFRWTGHFPDRTRRLLRHLAERARVLNQVYSVDHEIATAVAITTLVTALAMNHVHRGTYLA